jgi:hypothetical protein
MDARPRRAIGAAAALLAVSAFMAIGAATAGAEVVYNNVPSPLPGNFASIGLAATSSTEFGGEIELAGTARSQPTITVVMSSWACQSGGWNTSNCMTPKPNRTFKVPVTIRVYNVGELEEGPIAERTKTFKMKYRPSEDAVHCTPGHWYDATTAECFHGLAFPIAITLTKLKKMPKRSVITVAYPHSSGPAESLNVSTSEPPENTLSVGAQPVEEWFANSTSPEMYCPGATDVGKLGPEQGVGCQESINYQPVFAVSAN